MNCMQSRSILNQVNPIEKRRFLELEYIEWMPANLNLYICCGQVMKKIQ